MTKTLDDPIVDAAVERALAPLVGLLPPDVLEEKRRSLRLGLATHPRAQDILRRLRARPLVQRSGTVLTNDLQGAHPESEEEHGTGGAR
jgi:hypothetical protein